MALLAAQQNNTAAITSVSATAAMETGVGAVGRAFALADVAGMDAAIADLTPACLTNVARAVVRQGEFVAHLDIDEEAVRLIPAHSHDVRGSVRPEGWTYRVTMNGPHVTQTRERIVASDVAHAMYSRDPQNPWRGIGPLQVAANSGLLTGSVINALANEAGTEQVNILPMPNYKADQPAGAALRTMLSGANGGLAMVNDASTLTPEMAALGAQAQWQLRCVGPNPPVALVQLVQQASREVLGALDVPTTRLKGADGTGAREGYRQFLHGTVMPLATLVEAELRKKVHESITLSFDRLFASDQTGRARAFQSIVGGGME